MIRCHLSRLMARENLCVTEVARRTGLNRSTITALCRESVVRIELPALDRLCRLFGCELGELLEYVPDQGGEAA